MFRFLIAAFVLVACTVSATAGLRFEFDYQYDTDGFFDDPMRREALEIAGDLVNRYTDNLAAIEPDPENDNTWTTFFSPPGGNNILLRDVPVPEDTVIVYVGAKPMADRLAYSIDSPGIATGTPEFVDAYNYRGQPGAALDPATDYGLWGGSITFSSDGDAVPWYFGVDDDGIRSSQFDFITVAMHEIIHLMGFGLAKSFRDQTNALGEFAGPEAVAVGSLTNRSLKLDAFESHFEPGTKSRYNGRLQDSLMVPGIAPGRRQFLTQLDRAVLRDIGWEEAVAGDANLDRRFDTSDLITMFQGGKYETGLLAAWSDGDFDDNALFTSHDLVVALGTGTYSTAATSVDVLESETEPVLVAYDRRTGDLTVDGNGQSLTSIEIGSVNRLFDDDKVKAKLDGVFDVSRADKLFRMDLGGFSSFVFEEVLPVGLDFESIDQELRIDGSLLFGGPLGNVHVAVVPEPNALALVGFGSLFLLACFRRECHRK